MGVATRQAQAIEEASGITLVERKEMQHPVDVQFTLLLPIVIQRTGDQQRHGQFVEATAAVILRHQ